LFSHKKGHNPCKWNHRVDSYVCLPKWRPVAPWAN
jgi:hypothetical protein